MNKNKRRRNKKNRNRRNQQWSSNQQPPEWYGPDITGSFDDDPAFLDEATFAARDDQMQDNQYYSRNRGSRLTQS